MFVHHRAAPNTTQTCVVDQCLNLGHIHVQASHAIHRILQRAAAPRKPFARLRKGAFRLAAPGLSSSFRSEARFSDMADPPASKRLKAVPGGVRQRMRWHEAEQEHRSEPSSSHNLYSLLISKWSWGVFSAPLVQELADAAVRDGCEDPALKSLASIGSGGRFPGNCHRDILNIVPPTHAHKALSKFQVSIAQRPHGFLEVEHSLLLPHELFHIIYTHHPETFASGILGGGSDTVELFWHSMSDHPGYTEHPVKGRPEHKRKAVPIALHGDGVPVSGVGKSWSKSMDAYSWTSLLSRGPTAKVLFLIYIMSPKMVVKMEGRNFMEEFFKRLRWSLYWLFLGVFPLRDHRGVPFPPGSSDARRAGQPLAAGYFGVLWSLRADLDHMAKAYKFPFWNQAEPCGLCRANRTDKPWTDAKTNAAWTNTIWETRPWKEAAARHMLFELPGAGPWLFIPDIMHTLHLGVYSYFLGSVLELLVTQVLPRGVEANLAMVWERVKAEYKAT